MIVASVVKGFASIGLCGPGPNVYNNALVLHLAGASAPTNCHSLTTIAKDVRQGLVSLEGKCSLKGAVTIALKLFLVAASQAALTVSAMHSFSQVAKQLADCVPTLAALVVRIWGHSCPLPPRKPFRALAVPQLLLSVYAIIGIEQKVFPNLVKTLEREARKCLMNKYFRDTYFSSSIMLRALSYSQTDIYEGINEDVLSFATNTATSISLLAKASCQLAASAAWNETHNGGWSTFLLISVSLLNILVPWISRVILAKGKSPVALKRVNIIATLTSRLLRLLAVIVSYKIATAGIGVSRQGTKVFFATAKSTPDLLPAALHNLEVGSQVQGWVLRSLLLSNVCGSLGNVVRTALGPGRRAVNIGYNLSKTDAFLIEMRKRLGDSKGFSYHDSLSVKSLDITDPVVATKLLAKKLAFTVPPGSGMIVYCKQALPRTRLFQVLGKFTPAPKDAEICSPPSGDLLYLPRNSFYPRLASLKQQLLYPSVSNSLSEGENKLHEVLEKMGLGDLFRRSDDIAPDGLATHCASISRHLTKSEKQRIGLARALQHRPRYLILDGATDELTLEEESSFYSHCVSSSITTITAASHETLGRYVVNHKSLLQIDADGTFIFGSLCTPHVSEHPSLRIHAASIEAWINKIAAFDLASNQYSV